MAICKFFQQGNCRYGENCKFEHPRSGSGGFGGGANNNRFGAFNNVDRYRPNQPSQTSGSYTSNRDPKVPLFHLDKADIKNDLTGQRPTYPLSCYGPGRDAPRQLIEGPVEISPEELRVRYYAQRLAGNENGAQQEESALNEKMQQQVQSILNDIDGAIRYVEEGASVHPNRIDIANGNADSNATSTGPSTTSNPFSSAAANTSQATSNPFMKAPTATFGQSTTPGFGQPAFGQAANPGQSPAPAFGQASNPGQLAPAFGQASNPGQAAPGFGAASSLGAKASPFGSNPSAGTGGAFGKPAFGASGFGQPSMPGSVGQGSIFGAKPAFGQASPAGSTAPFGQPSQMGQQGNALSKPAFGQSGFGQASPFGQATQTSASPSGQTAQASASPFGQAAQTSASPFGQAAKQTPAQGAPPFGQASQPGQQQSPFGSTQAQPASGQSNPFAAAGAPQANPFGQAARPTTAGSPFGGQASQTTPPQTQNPFLQKPAASAATPAAASPFGTQATQPASQFGQQAVSQTPGGPAKEIDPKERFKEGKPGEYEGEQGKMLEEIYRRVGQMGRFNDNEDIPLTPPKCEWIVTIPL